MTTLTFDRIRQIVAEHQRAEEARNAPTERAYRALDDLRCAMIDMARDERLEMVYLLGQVVSDAIDAAGNRDDRSWELAQDLSATPF